MLTKKRKIGDLGEDIALKFLEKKGYNLIEKNYFKKTGEIDIIVKSKEKFLFVEVKTTSIEDINKIKYSPEDHFNNRKIEKFKGIVLKYTKEKNISESYNLSVIFVYLKEKEKKAKVKFIENIFI